MLYKNGDWEFVINWTPINLLNIDYKLAAKDFAERLKSIKIDQKAFIKGRQISDHSRLTNGITKDLHTFQIINIELKQHLCED